MATATVAKKTPRQPPISDQARETILGMLALSPRPTDNEIALAAGVSRSKVLQIRKGKEQDTEESTERYGRSLAKRLPMQERVRIWGQLARGEVDPRQAFVQKAALQRVEELIGHVTAKEKRESEANQSAPGPIFVFQNTMPVSVQPVIVDPDKSKG